MSTERHVCQTCLENVDAELQFYKLDLTYDLDDSTLRDKLYSCVPEYEDVSTVYSLRRHFITHIVH